MIPSLPPSFQYIWPRVLTYWVNRYWGRIIDVVPLHSFYYDRWTPSAMILLLFMAEFSVSEALKKHSCATQEMLKSWKAFFITSCWWKSSKKVWTFWIRKYILLCLPCRIERNVNIEEDAGLNLHLVHVWGCLLTCPWLAHSPDAYLIIVTDATDAVSVNFSGRCKFLQI